MKIVLINPPPKGELEKHWAPYPILGLAYVAAALRARGHEIVLLDGKLAELSVSAICERATRAHPDLVGITCMTVEFPLAAKIAAAVRAASAVPIVLGGAHVNAVGAQVLEECPAADYACVGEGEHLVCELAEALSGSHAYSHIAGLAFRDGGRVVKNPAREYHDDYDALPFPAWDLFNVGSQIPLLTHRGCPFECNFCGHNSGFKPRYRSPKNVLDEIEWVVMRFAPATMRIEDETFGLNVARTRRILDGILERGLHRKIRFSAQTRVDRVDAAFIKLLKSCNFETLELGVESGNPEVLRRMGKGITLEQVESAVRLAKANGLRVWCKFILGHPNETRRDMLDTADFIARINPDRLSVSVMTPFPGTPIFDMAVRGEGGYRLLSQDWGSFDKYASGALELEGASLFQLKVLQIWCYLKLYVRNNRIGDLAALVTGNHKLVWEMIRGLAAQLVSRSGRFSRHPVATPAALRARAPLSNAASPDSTLVRLRKRAARDPVPAASERAKPLRSWAAPGN